MSSELKIAPVELVGLERCVGSKRAVRWDCSPRKVAILRVLRPRCEHVRSPAGVDNNDSRRAVYGATASHEVELHWRGSEKNKWQERLSHINLQ